MQSKRKRIHSTILPSNKNFQDYINNFSIYKKQNGCLSLSFSIDKRFIWNSSVDEKKKKNASSTSQYSIYLCDNAAASAMPYSMHIAHAFYRIFGIVCNFERKDFCVYDFSFSSLKLHFPLLWLWCAPVHYIAHYTNL